MWGHQVSEICWFIVSVSCLFCLCCEFVLLVLVQWLYFNVTKHWVLSFAEEEEEQPGMWVMQYYCWNWFSVEFCTNDMVLLMLGFFCRSNHSIEISRWVKLFLKLMYDLLSCVYAIVVVCFSLCVLCVFFLVRRRGRRRGRWSSGSSGGHTLQGSLLGKGGGTSG